MNTICAIGVYFGKLPNYFELWLKSAQYNPRIDFFIFTDDIVENVPENVKVVYLTIEEMKKLAEDKLQQQIVLDKPYKCCDFKPVYGVIFADYVSDYEYWGHFDIDLIMGDLYSFLIKYNYETYDRFMHLGHFSFYRNCERVNEYYKLPGSLVGDYKTVFSTAKSFAFDEMLGMGSIYASNKLPVFNQKIYADISCHHKRFRLSDLCCVEGKVSNYKYQVFYWKEGKTYRSYLKNGKIFDEEFAYIHFQKRPNFNVSFDSKSTDAFFIGVNGFTKKDIEVSKAAINIINPYPGFFVEFLESQKYNMSIFTKKVKGKLGINK